jgi:hypothetical protein
LSRPEDLRNPLGVGKVDLDRGIDCGFVVRLIALSTKGGMQTLAREVGDTPKRGLVVHEDDTARVWCPGSLQDSLGTHLFNGPPNPSHHIPVIPLIENARDMKHAVLEDFHRDLLAKKRAIAI